MRRLGFLIAAIVVVIVMAAAVLLREAARPASNGQQGFAAIAVAADEVRLREFADTVDAIGTVRANESVQITSKVADVISRIAFESGDRVTAGQVLAELADREESALLNEARATLNEARRELTRARELAERGVAAQTRVQEMQAAADRAQARVGAIEARLADRIIRAPFDGVIGLRNISVGELARPGDILATLDDISVIKLDFTAPERFLSVLAQGMEIRATAAAWPGEVFTGTIANIDSRVDPVTRAVTVRAEIPNEDGRLAPGMLMQVQVRRDVRMRPAIPEPALVRMQDRAFVFVITETERGAQAQQRFVTIGQRREGWLEVLDGLQPGERIVAQGTHRLRDGAPVRVAQSRVPGAAGHVEAVN
ncbi:MAG: efflux RND transporter periplasmic adaptor subunit [Maricaulaceae bacterium]|nr:efflux RND transporter periplasmic adaptor subunit [Maricaulaceae bacterium]